MSKHTFDRVRNSDFKKATKEIITEIETAYIELDADIDGCQGCTEDCEMLLYKLNIYKQIVRFLGR